MAYDASYPADDLYIADIPKAIRDKGEQLKTEGIVKPAAHKSTHASGGTDAISPSDIGAVASSEVSTTATANKIVKRDANGKVAGSITGDADTVDGYHAGTTASTLLLLDSSGKVPVANLPVATASVAGVVTLGSVNHGKKMFTSSGTFTVPIGVTTVWVTLCGGGGGGGGAYSATYYGGGGGGADAKIAQTVDVSTIQGQSVAVTVGTGGSTGTGSGTTMTAGGTGGTSSFGSYISASGGGGGGAASSSAYGSAGVAGGSGGCNGYSGDGGGSIFGPAALVFTGLTGRGYGGGGSGGTPASRNGGNGAPGFVLVEW